MGPSPSERLGAFLDSLGIVHTTVEHRPLFTVEEGRDLHASIPGLHCKNLFLKDKRGLLWLIVMPGDLRADLARLSGLLKATRLSFAAPALLAEVLGVTPGSVSPFALMNDTERCVNVVVDRSMMQSPHLAFHPLRNDASTTIRAVDLRVFLEALGYAPLERDCGGTEVPHG